jgi:hypothetical protein
MTDTPDRIERTLEVLLYAPIGIGMFLKDTAPSFVDMFVSRGRAEVDRRQGDVQQRVTTAKSLGQVALAFGPPVIRKKVEEKVADARGRVESLLGTSSSGRPEPTPSTPEPAPVAVPMDVAESAAESAAQTVAQTVTRTVTTPPAADAPSNGDLSSSSTLPIPGYDALSASQVVERLTGLTSDELDAVHEYEAAHRKRRTILGKIEQLAG